MEFLFIHCKAVKVSQNYQTRVWTWFTSVFLMNGTELRSFSQFQILKWILYSDISRNLQIDLFRSLSSFTVKLRKSVIMINFICKHDLEVFSWWMEQDEEVLVIFKFWPKSHTRTLVEIFKLTNFEICLPSL